MTIAYVLLATMGMLLAAMGVQRWVAEPLRLPFSAVLVLVGFVGAQLVVGAGIDTGLRWYHIHDLVFYVFLPVLIFDSAFKIDARALTRDLVPVLVLAVPGMLLATFATAALVYYGIGHAAGFPWLSALIAGALLSATDPAAVLDLSRRLGAPARLNLLLEGESLFNDATTILLYGLLVGLATGSASATVDEAALRFVALLAGGAGIGAVTGLLGAALMRALPHWLHRSVLTIIAAYVSYLAAEALLQVSGIISVLVAGIVMGEAERRRAPAGETFVGDLWELNAWIANSLTFLLVGVTITLPMFTERWLAMLIGIGAVLAVRFVLVYGALPVLGRLPGVRPVPAGYRPAITWGGVRGAVTVALALSLPLEVEAWWTIQSVAYGVVLFTLLVQAPTMAPLLRRMMARGRLDPS